jgi:hypothetical protein
MRRQGIHRRLRSFREQSNQIARDRIGDNIRNQGDEWSTRPISAGVRVAPQRGNFVRLCGFRGPREASFL